MNKPMHILCGAYCRTTGQPCKGWAMQNGRCRMHGGKTPIKTGFHTKAMKALRKRVAANRKRILALLRGEIPEDLLG